MIEIDDKIVSADLLQECFACDISRCKGICCVEGDAGAPLELDEVDILEEEYDAYAKYMTEEGRREVEKQGFMVVDADGDYTTPLVNNAECAFAFTENGITYCAIERAYRNGECSFIKPIRRLERSFDIGMYLIYIFSIAMASMADFSNLDLREGVNQILFLCIAVFGSMLLHALFCRFMRVEADAMVASSVAFINSPPFVPMMVVAMKNKSVLIVGLGAGIVGYAAGNYFGVIMAKLLEML